MAGRGRGLLLKRMLERKSSSPYSRLPSGEPQKVGSNPLRRNPFLQQVQIPPKPQQTLNGHFEREKEFSSIPSFDDRLDYEFNKFVTVIIRNTDVEITCMKHEKKDLFTVSEDYSLAHCVAEDLWMSRGIAVEFKERFGSVEYLRSQNQKSGGLAVLKEAERYIYYLITKRVSYGKPTYKNLYSSLMKMREHIESKGVKKVAIPTIGCGLDELDWEKVRIIIELIFGRVKGLKILVCHWK